MFDLSPDAEFVHQTNTTDGDQSSIAISPLLQCPPLAKGLCAALMATDESGRSVEVGRYTMMSPEPIENLAHVRYAAVHAGAREIAVWC